MKFQSLHINSYTKQFWHGNDMHIPVLLGFRTLVHCIRGGSKAHASTHQERHVVRINRSKCVVASDSAKKKNESRTKDSSLPSPRELTMPGASFNIHKNTKINPMTVSLYHIHGDHSFPKLGILDLPKRPDTHYHTHPMPQAPFFKFLPRKRSQPWTCPQAL